jgi:hypothetical protein
MKLLLPVGHHGPTYQCPFCRTTFPVPAAPPADAAMPMPSERPVVLPPTGPRAPRLPIPCFVYVILGVAFVVVGFGVLVVMAVQLKKSAARALALNHMKQIGLACAAFQSTHNHLPTPKHLQAEDSDPVELSWRVSILPYIEEMPLFRTFDETDGWDSPANEKLLDKGPSIYFDPQLQQEASTATHYQLFTGPGTMFRDNDKVKMDQGQQSTIFLFAEAAQAVPWSKPADMVIQPDRPLPLPQGTFLVARADVTVLAIDRTNVSDTALRWYLCPNDGPPPPLE